MWDEVLTKVKRKSARLHAFVREGTVSDFRRVCKVDSWTNQEKPRKNYAPTRFLRMNANSGDIKRAYLFFALPDTGIIDNGITIVSAHLKVYLYDGWAGHLRVTRPQQANPIEIGTPKSVRGPERRIGVVAVRLSAQGALAR
jgi:hypothetical protein